jgi:ATP-dependent HslUV protease ATP-binding subunit HslU
MKKRVASIVEERILDLFIGLHADDKQRESFRALLRDGSLEDRLVEVEVPSKPQDGRGPAAAAFFDASGNANQIANEIMRITKLAGGGAMGGAKERKKMTIAEARPIIEEQELEKMLEGYDIIKEAIAAVEESGIVFIDEIDKLISGRDGGGHSAGKTLFLYS